ncbi:MAG: DUF488 domain-containing protein [Alphaproteobacteria bacterium]|nr:DUF488 domain-containing protein [Alphaproteobacteria bacterium]
MHTLKIKRIYNEPSKEDGIRVLVDRLWPRGIKKEEAGIDLWLKEAAPSTELRKWIHQQPEKWSQFPTRFHAELRRNPESVQTLLDALKKHPVTLLYAAKNEKQNHALVLKEYVEELLEKR